MSIPTPPCNAVDRGERCVKTEGHRSVHQARSGRRWPNIVPASKAADR